MESLDQQMREYQEIKGWLAGKKPPAAGRTWRRRMRDALPAPVRTTMIALAPRAGSLMLRACIGLAMALSLPLFDALMAPEPLTGAAMAVRGVVGWLQPLVIGISLLTLGMASLAFLLGGHD